MSSHRFGLDIGGTFTDVAVVESETGRFVKGLKLLSSKSPEEAATDGFAEARQQVEAESGSDVRHATTYVSNMLLEGDWSRAGMLTTCGFRDVIELNRQVRPEPFDLFFQRAQPLIPRDHRIPLDERIDAQGEVLRPLAHEEVRGAVEELVDTHEVEAVAVCFLNSYRNSVHEEQAARIIRDGWPDMTVVTSSGLLPRRGEFERFMTTAVNASTSPLFSSYLQRLTEGVSRNDSEARLLIMTSDGHLSTPDMAADRAVAFSESGPAAGVIAAQKLANQRDGTSRAITFDVGGTTAKVGVIVDGRAEITRQYSVGGSRHGRMLGAASGGYAIGTPVIDLVEIGSGGGSILWIDPGGALRVGPISAGSDPGPMCYGLGGERPTLTDALVVSGVLNSEALLGGELPLNLEAAQRGLEGLGRQLGLDTVEVAVGGVRVAATAMLQALRSLTVERGLDPTGFSMVPFGGMGPSFGAMLADELGVQQLLVPRNAGVFSAWGLTMAEPGASRTVPVFEGAVSDLDAESLMAQLSRMIEEVHRELVQRHPGQDGDIVVQAFTSARYLGQSSELEVAWPEVADDGSVRADVRSLEERFHDAHRDRYGFSHGQSSVEATSVRVEGRFVQRDGVASSSQAPVDEPAVSQPRVRMIELLDPSKEAQVLTSVPPVGTEGPLVVEQYDTTIFIPPGWTVSERTDTHTTLRRHSDPPDG